MDDQLDLREFTEDMLAIARTNLERDGDLMPMAFVLTQTGDVHALGLADLSTDRNKRTSYMMVSKYAAKEHAQAVLLINDAWTLRPEDSPKSREECNHIRPSQHPKRVEAIVCTLVGPSGNILSGSVQAYTRDPADSKIIRWEKPIDMGDGLDVSKSEQHMLPPWGPKVPREEVLS